MIRMINTSAGVIPFPQRTVKTRPVSLGCPTCNVIPMNNGITYEGYGTIMDTLTTFWTNHKGMFLIAGAGMAGFGIWYFLKRKKG
jgi:LPXTG-motif cell wall-anchored protein